MAASSPSHPLPSDSVVFRRLSWCPPLSRTFLVPMPFDVQGDVEWDATLELLDARPRLMPCREPRPAALAPASKLGAAALWFGSACLCCC